MSSIVIDDLEGVRSSRAFKTPCRVATTGAIALSGLQSVDGVTLASDDRVLVKDQATAADNGVYKAAAGGWTRAEDFDASRDVVSGTKIFVTSGATNRRREFYLQSADPITIGVSDLVFGQSEPVTGMLFDTVLSKSASYSVVPDDEGALILVDASGGAATITLPSIASAGDFKLAVAKTDASANAVAVARAASDTINGATSISLAVQHETATLAARGGTTSWIALQRANLPRLNATNAFAAAQNWARGADIASAATTDIGAAGGNYVTITGTTTITALGTVQAGTWRLVRFAGALTLNHNATSLILPTTADITTVAGDTALFVSEGSGNWRCAMYMRGDAGFIPKWQSYTPVITPQAGSFTSVSATGRHLTLGNIVFVQMEITITTNGTASGFITASLPSTPSQGAVFNGLERAVAGWVVRGQIWVGTPICTITKYDTTYPGGNGYVLLLNGQYEI